MYENVKIVKELDTQTGFSGLKYGIGDDGETYVIWLGNIISKKGETKDQLSTRKKNKKKAGK